MFSSKNILLLLLFLFSCSLNKNNIQLLSTNFTDEVEQQQNLVFTFNKDLVSDSMIDKWDSSAYIKFTPAARGMFKWLTKKELVFSPAEGFLPSTNYQGDFTKDLLKFADLNSSLQDLEPVTFHTPYLKLMELEPSWQKSERSSGSLSLQVILHFNYRVDPGELLQHAQLLINKKVFDFELKSSSASNEVTIIAAEIPFANTAEAIVDINLMKGLRCFDSQYKTTSIQTVSQLLHSPEKLSINQVQGIFDGGDGLLEVYTNQPVETADIKGLIKLSPSVDFILENLGSGFALRGNFTAGASYEITVLKKLKGMFGGEMQNDFIALVPFGQLEPSLSFAASNGIYLSSKGSKTIGINIVNIPHITLTVTRIFENNIQQYIRSNRYNEYNGEDESYSWSYSDYAMEEMGEVVMKRDYETKNLGKVNGVNLLQIDLAKHGQFNGVYLVNVESKDDRWRKAVRLVSVSDIGLIARSTPDEILVFANSILTTNPVAGIQVNFISKNNQVLFTSTTNKDGVAIFSNVKSKFPGFQVAMITAGTSGDFNFMVFNDSRVENSRFDVGGARLNESEFQAFVYGDREIYRPGETIYNNIIIRNQERLVAGNNPVKIKYVLPNGREWQTVRKTPDKQGSCEVSMQIPVEAVTGTYTLEVYSANDLLIESKNISVEEFIPDRINVILNTDKESYFLLDSIRANFNAVNLFGPPAANRNYEAEFTVRKKYFISKAFPGYQFNIKEADKVTFPVTIKQGKTNVDGNAKELFSLNSSYADEGILAGKLFVTVFDESGRPVNRVKNFDIKTQDVFYGIRIPEYYVGTKQKIMLGFAAASADGTPVLSQAARIQVVKVNWHTIMERTYDTHFRYVSQREEEVLLDRTIPISKSGAVFPFVPNESGEYLVRISRPGSQKYVESTFYAYRWGNTANTSFQVNNEGQVEISLDKEKYQPGDKAKLLFKTPFAGKLLVTVERNKVFEYHYLHTDKKSAMLTLPINEKYLPNVYVTATLFKPLDDGSFPLTVAHGFVNIGVEKQANKLPVNIIVATSSKSKTKQQITVKTIAKAAIQVTVAVVDEGIMQLKNSPTPDPYNYFYRKQALQVNSFDVYPLLLPDLKIQKSAAGGDGYDLQKRVNPLSNKRVKLVAYWSGILKTNGAGEATCSVDIPQFSGDLRVMAVAYNDQAFGSDEKHIKVTDPIVISTSLPRFLSPGDTLFMPVTISNTMAKASGIKATVSVKGPLLLIGKSAMETNITPASENRLFWKIVAQKSVGEGVVDVQVNANGEGYTDKTDITIRQTSSLQKISDAGSVQAGTTKLLNLQHPFVSSEASSRLILSRSPMVQFSDQLDYLLDYPYGCVEQTTSIAFPQLYYADLVKVIKNKNGQTLAISRNVQAAINKLQTMQLYNGSLSYWPGGEEESWWGSAYACHFLLESKKAGYEVNQKIWNKILAYLAVKARSKTEVNYEFYEKDQKRVTRKKAAKDIFYSLYVLALSGQSDLATMNYYKYKTTEMSLDSRYMLATTFLICGDRKAYDQLLPAAFEGEKAAKESGGSFSSYVRDEALALTGLLESDPENPQVGIMVNHLSKQLKNEKYLSTQERAFAFLALGKFMNATKQNNATAQLTVDGKNLASFTGEELILTQNILGKNINVEVKGTGSIYYSWEAKGVSKDGFVKEEDNFLRIRKVFYTRFGKPITGNLFHQNDLIVVKLTLENTERTNVNHVVITDILPAGFEIENPRIGAVPELGWIKDKADPEHTDVRDDRINIFTSIDHTGKNFYYLVRAVSLGKFNMGPVSADAMYNGEYHSYYGAGVVEVIEK